MAKQLSIEQDGTVTESLGNAMFRVELVILLYEWQLTSINLTILMTSSKRVVFLTSTV